MCSIVDLCFLLIICIQYFHFNKKKQFSFPFISIYGYLNVGFGCRVNGGSRTRPGIYCGAVKRDVKSPIRVLLFFFLFFRLFHKMSVLPKLTSSGSVTAEIKSVCVFCGSGNGADPAYALEAYGNAINDTIWHECY